jgi:hypothetical protein
VIRLAILLIRPLEIWHQWQWKRAYAKGKYVRPDNDRAAITTKVRHEPWVGFSDEPTECSCGSMWFECQQRRAALGEAE